LPPTTPTNDQPHGTFSQPPKSVPLTLGGVLIHKLVKKNNLRSTGVLSKYERTKADQTERMKLFNNVVKRQQIGVFKSLPNDINDPKQLHPLGLICLGPLILGKNTCRSEVILLDQFMDEDSSQTEWNRFRRLRERSVRLITCWSSGRQFGLASTHCMS
jgi:hypothetical protein